MSKKVHGLNYINQNVYLLYPFYYRLIKSVILAVEYRIKMQPIAKLIQKQQTLHRLSVLQVNKEVFIWQCLPQFYIKLVYTWTSLYMDGNAVNFF